MRIIIDADFLLPQYVSAPAQYINTLLLEMAARHPDHNFIYVTHAPLAISAVPANVTFHSIKHNLVRWLGPRWWHTFVLPYAVKKLQADLFIAIHPNVYSRHVPGCIFLLDEMNRQYSAAALQKARVLFATSAHARQHIAARYALPPEKIHVLPLPGTGEMPEAATDAEKEAVKLQYTQGIEYFLFAGDIAEQHQLLELLKAFAHFKKWQQSNMQLVIAGNATAWTGELLQKTASFRYRHDVHILPGCPVQTVRALTAAAYAFVYPEPAGYFSRGIIPAMKAGVPVITSGTTAMKELAGNAVLYAVPGNEQDFSANMQLLYKDEMLRKEMIERARQHLQQAASNDMAADCWQTMMQSLP